MHRTRLRYVFFFNDTATTEIYTLSLHDALPISLPVPERARFDAHIAGCDGCTAYLEQMRTTIALTGRLRAEDRKSTRLNSSHSQISYAVFCLKKKHTNHLTDTYARILASTMTTP